MRDSNPSLIEDFVNRRWGEARETLGQLDSDFVDRLGVQVRLEQMGLFMPLQCSAKDKPDKRLPKRWHGLLEACCELMMQAECVKVAAMGLNPRSSSGLSEHDAGRLCNYHFRSWFIHALALTERTEKVIQETAKLRVPEAAKAKEIAKRHRANVKEVAKRFTKQRNSYLHANRSWVSGITKDQLWEYYVAGEMTPSQFLREFHYPSQSEDVKAGKHEHFENQTEKLLDELGSIMRAFEENLSAWTAERSG